MVKMTNERKRRMVKSVQFVVMITALLMMPAVGMVKMMSSAKKYLTRLIKLEDQDLDLLTLAFRLKTFVRLEIILSCRVELMDIPITGVVLRNRPSVDVADPVGRKKSSMVKTLVNKLVAALLSMLASLTTLGGNCRQLESKWRRTIFSTSSISAHTGHQTGQQTRQQTE